MSVKPLLRAQRRSPSMKHLAALLAVVATILLFSGVSLAKPDKGSSSDPVFPTGTTKHVSDWIRELRSGEELKTRQRALVAMKLIGPKVPGVVLAVCDTLREEKDINMRVDAAQ